jgi:hypothetical protein
MHEFIPPRHKAHQYVETVGNEDEKKYHPQYGGRRSESVERPKLVIGAAELIRYVGWIHLVL